MQPIEHLTQWLQNEHSAGAPNPQHAVLSTANRDAVPHCRVVAIREMNDQGLRCKNFHCLYLNNEAIGENDEQIPTH